jgi:hypothetical protein
MGCNDVLLEQLKDKNELHKVSREAPKRVGKDKAIMTYQLVHGCMALICCPHQLLILAVPPPP